MKEIYDIVEEPRGDDYRLLLECCSAYCQIALLVVREADWLEPSASEFLRNLNPFEVEKRRQSEWPGTSLLDHEATVYYYSLCRESLHILKHAVDRLFDWQQPYLPEDLCLLRNENDPMLVTIAHEKDAFLFLTPDEKANLLRAVPNIQLKQPGPGPS